MATPNDPHLDEETAEWFSMGTLSGKVTAQVEEHLLICERCRQILAASDAYVAAMRLAAEKLRQAERKPKSKAGGSPEA